jgi:hypothetical protein
LFNREQCLKDLQKKLGDGTFMDITYSYPENPGLRFKANSKFTGSKIFVSLIYPVFSIKGCLIKELTKVEEVFENYDYVDMAELMSIRLRNLAANNKMMKDTSLFDCFFSDPD